MNPAKRRRLDATASTLRKPFRSPLKVPANHPASSQPAVTNNLDQQRPNPSPTPALSLIHDSRTGSSRQSSSPSKSKLKKGPSQPTDEVTTLQKQYSALTQELRRLKQDLDVAEQARKLHLNTQTQQLEQLTSKWRDIARSAADEVFEITSSRVKDMGGIQAWQKNTQESSQSWLDSNTSQDDAHHYERDHDQGRYPDSARASDAEEEEETNEQQEQSFTMTTMLRQMNIDPNLLDFDERNDQWAD